MSYLSTLSRFTFIAAACTLMACGESSSSASPQQDAGADLDQSAQSEDMTTTAPDMGQSSLEDMNSAPDLPSLPDLTETEITLIHLKGDAIEVEGPGAGAVSVEGTHATITAPGYYRVDGTLNQGALTVQSPDDGLVYVQLAGVDITSATGSPLHILEADEMTLEIVAGTKNRLEDAAQYVFPDPEEDEPNAALYSKDDLLIVGGGDLEIVAKYNDGLTSKDDLEIAIEGTLTVNAVDDGLRGKDSLTIQGGTFVINAGGDGLKSDNDSEVERGNITIHAGQFQITSGSDGMQAEQVLSISAGTFNMKSGGGSSASLAADASAKGLKGLAKVHILGGTFNIDAADDAVHSDDTIVIEGGQLEISTGDDGVHADVLAHIKDGKINVTKSYEGIESAKIVIDGGEVRVTTSDDGLNGAGGDGESGGFGGPPGSSSSNYLLIINGGYVVVNAQGDGLDANGTIEMTGGTVIVHGPTADMNGPLDYDKSFVMTGGLLVATGSSRMAQAPSATGTTQPSMLINLSAKRSAGELFHLRTADGAEVLTIAPLKAYQSIAFSSPQLTLNTTYSYFAGGSSTGVNTDGLFVGGAYTPGTQLGSLTTSSVVTKSGR